MEINQIHPMQAIRDKCIDFCKKQFYFIREVVWQRFHCDHNCLTIAGDLSYITVVAITPCFILFAWLWTKFPSVQEQIVEHLTEIAIGPDSTVIQEYLSNFKTNAEQMGSYGIVILVAIVLYFLFALQKAMDRIFHTETKFSPDKLTSRLLHCFVVLPVAALILVSFLSMTVSWIADVRLPFVGNFVSWLGDIPRLVLEAAFFIILYKFGPSRRVRLRDAFFGAVLAMFLMELLRFSFVKFTSYASYEALYGAFKTLPMLMLWLWLFWIAALLGAVLTAALPDYSRISGLIQNGTRGAFLDCLEILYMVWLCREKTMPTSLELHAMAKGLSFPRMMDLLNLLSDKKYLHFAKKDDTISLHIWEDKSLLDLWREVDPGGLACTMGSGRIEADELPAMLLWRMQKLGSSLEGALSCTVKELFQAKTVSGLPAPIGT